jgi:hypothetical protein
LQKNTNKKLKKEKTKIQADNFIKMGKMVQMKESIQKNKSLELLRTL